MYDQYDDHMLSLTTTMWLWRPIVILIKTDWGGGGWGEGNISKPPNSARLSEVRAGTVIPPSSVRYDRATGGEDILFQFPVLLLPAIRTPPPIWDQQPPGMWIVYPLQPNQSQIENSWRGMWSLRISINQTGNFGFLGEHTSNDC